MSATSRREVLEQDTWALSAGGAKASGRRLLDEICALCGYERKYASKLLRGRRLIAERAEGVVEDRRPFTVRGGT